MSVKKTTPQSLGVELPRLGFGAMRLPLGEDGKIDREASDAMIDLALENGVNYFDTAYGYLNGESEPYVGESLARYPRERYMLATKMPVWLLDGTTEKMEGIFNEQLSRCRVDYFDFYLMHSLSDDRIDSVRKWGVYEYLRGMKEQGKIRKLGFSFHGSHELFRSLLEEYEWDFVQIQYNYVDAVKLGMDELYDLLRQKGIPCVAMEPVRGGFLASPPEAVKAEFDALDGGKTSAAGWALRWCLAKDNLPLILSGMSSIEQVRDNLATFDEAAPDTLTGAEAAAIDRAREIILSIKTVPCTACRYCMDCPSGVDIPGNFTLYNDYMLFKNAFAAKNGYDSLTAKKASAPACTRCGICSPLCPQGIAIPDRLEEAHKVLSAVKL